MQVAASDLAQQYSQKSNEELLSLHKSGTLTDVAYEVLESEMRQRNISIPARSAVDDVLVADENAFQRQTLKGHWRGEARLVSAFWLIGVAAGWIFGGIVVFAAAFAPQWLFLAIVAYLAFFAFSSVSIWRCARNTSWVGWGYMARGVVVLNAVSILFIVQSQR